MRQSGEVSGFHESFVRGLMSQMSEANEHLSEEFAAR